MGSSPHTRGALESDVYDWKHSGIIPAYAGSTDVFPLAGDIVPDHPRIRGEHYYLPYRRVTYRGSSPHTRGAPHAGVHVARRPRIIPAYAGSTTSTVSTPPWRRGSSPHTRGAPPGGTRSFVRARIIPAYAGSTAKQALNTVYGKGSSPHTRGAPVDYEYLTTYYEDHPRIRGEHW